MLVEVCVVGEGEAGAGEEGGGVTVLRGICCW